jgi:hypothetical protein
MPFCPPYRFNLVLLGIDPMEKSRGFGFER